MPSPLNAIFKAIKKLAPQQMDQAAERVALLSQQTPLELYSPSAIARATTFSPAAQRGFSESLVSSKAPVATTLVRPSEWAARTPSLDESDRHIVEYLKQSIGKDKLKDFPLLWLDQYPKGLEAGYEGRHRMQALKELYGDIPVPTNIVPGAEYRMVQTPYYPEPSREYVQELAVNPLELLRRQMQFGDRPFKIDPLWVKE